MKKPVHPVTDHAVIRYLERVRDVDIAAIRREIGHIVDKAVELNASGAIVDGFVYRLCDGTVITVTPHNQPNRRTGYKRRKVGAGG